LDKIDPNCFPQSPKFKKIDFPLESPAAGLLKVSGVTSLNAKLISSLKIECSTWLNVLATAYLEGNHFVG
jgi:hypothetical protein